MELGLSNYWLIVVLMMAGLYVVIAKSNLVKTLLGLNVFQTSVIMLYVSMGKVRGGTAPIVEEGFTTYSNPLPQVLMLTAIVVGVAITALGLSFVIRIHATFGTIEEDELDERFEREDSERAERVGDEP